MNNDTLLNIASEFETPLYVYDAESIKNQYQNLISAFPEKTKFFYACKALTKICRTAGRKS